MLVLKSNVPHKDLKYNREKSGEKIDLNPADGILKDLEVARTLL